MSTDHGADSPKLLCFSVPGLPEMRFAIWLPQVLEITALPGIAPLPYAPQGITGLSVWREQVVTVVDLAAVLRCGSMQPFAGEDSTTHMIAYTWVRGSAELVAWPITARPLILHAPPHAPAADPPAHLRSSMLSGSFRSDGECVHILNMEAFSPMPCPDTV